MSRSPIAGALDEASLVGRLVEFTQGSYLLDQGDGSGRRPFSDLEHRLRFGALLDDGAGASDSDEDAQDPAAWLCVGARGETPFGSFVSLGVVAQSETGLELTLARRYLEQHDARTAWAARDALESISPAARKAPWRELPLSL